MDLKQCGVIAALGCALVILFLVVAIPVAFFLPARVSVQREVPGIPAVAELGATATPRPTRAPNVTAQAAVPTLTPVAGARIVVPTLAAAEPAAGGEARTAATQPDSNLLTALYDQVNPGVVNIAVFVQQGGTTGQGAGSGFILDDQGHIVTNDHVVQEATSVIAVFHDGTQVEADIIGTDADSDLAVIQVPQLPDGAHPLPLGDSDQVDEGQWAVAIGNPFAQQSSMTAGIISAKGRIIPSLSQGFSIPEAIQTDAAINPGNSGGPLLNLQGEVIGVNAQIRSGGVAANSGVGFAIPSNIVRRVVPVLIERGEYRWPWIGIQAPPGGVNLLIAQANDLPTQRGAYIDEVIPDSPADDAGLQGSTGTTQLRGLQVPVGGDVIVEVDGQPIQDFADLLVEVAFRQPGDSMQVTILRDGQRRQLTVNLEARPAQLGR
jgi:S1-C subfamily serine protease